MRHLTLTLKLVAAHHLLHPPHLRRDLRPIHRLGKHRPVNRFGRLIDLFGSDPNRPFRLDVQPTATPSDELYFHFADAVRGEDPFVASLVADVEPRVFLAAKDAPLLEGRDRRHFERRPSASCLEHQDLLILRKRGAARRPPPEAD